MLEKHENNQFYLEELADKKLEEMKELSAVKYALNLILEKLPGKYPSFKVHFGETLPYHGEAHARDVMHEAILFALAEGIKDQRDLELLSVAAAFHDSGFILEYDNNELLGADIATGYMKKSGSYSDTEIERVRQMILSTQVKFEPEFSQLVQNKDDILQRILADADVSNFGRADFAEKADKVFQELLGIGKIPADTKEHRISFNKFREKMIKTHDWNTDGARSLRNEQKIINLKTLKKFIIDSL